SKKPRCAYRKTSVMSVSICAPYAARISLVEIGSLPGSSVVPMMPPSRTIVRCGACRCRATAEASSGMPTPAKTTLWSASSRLAVTAISSSAVTSLIGPPPRRSSPHQLPRVRRQRGQPLRPGRRDEPGEAGVAVDVLFDITQGPGRPLFLRGGGIGGEMLEVGPVEAVTLVRVRAVRRRHDRVDGKKRQHRLGRAG